MIDWTTYAIHDNENIKGFFGDYRWLSNFHPCQISFCGYNFPATENAYMAFKTTDASIRKQFENLAPKDAKKFGRSIILRSDWDLVRYRVMYAVNMAKYTQNPDLRQKLLDTGTKYLEETNSWNDTYWGVCNGIGESNLGKVIMDIREVIR